MILIAGATGFLGGEICRRLVGSGETVRGLVRATSDHAAVERLRGLGVETVVGDVRDRPSLDAACRGVRTVVSTVTTTRSIGANRSRIAAAIDSATASINWRGGPSTISRVRR